jgi:hypothetical protein
MKKKSKNKKKQKIDQLESLRNTEIKDSEYRASMKTKRHLTGITSTSAIKVQIRPTSITRHIAED